MFEILFSEVEKAYDIWILRRLAGHQRHKKSTQCNYSKTTIVITVTLC